MFAPCDVNLIYDASFDGLLSTVFFCFKKRLIPLGISSALSCEAGLFREEYVSTDLSHAKRIKRFLWEKTGRENADLVRLAYLCSLKDKELLILNYIILLTKVGPSAYYLEANETVGALKNAVKNLENEAHLFRGFVRFVESGGVLCAKISPKNRVLPLLANHFLSRFRNEELIIYDSSHKEALFCKKGKCHIKGFNMPIESIFEEDGEYEKLWKIFINSVNIEERKNPKCQMTHMPKRYWQNMTEARETAKK